MIIIGREVDYTSRNIFAQSFFSKRDSSEWGKQKEAEILNGSYLKDLKLKTDQMREYALYNICNTQTLQSTTHRHYNTQTLQ